MQEKFKKFLFLFQLHQNIFSSMCYTGVTGTTAIAPELSNPRGGADTAHHHRGHN